MKYALFFFAFFYSLVSVTAQYNPFTTKWKPVGTSFTVPVAGTASYSYNIAVYNSSNVRIDTASGRTSNYTVSGLTAGATYTVKISGTFPQIYFNNSGSKNDIIEIVKWGNIKWATMSVSFYGCANLENNATDVPDLTSSSATDIAYAFRDCSKLTGTSANWAWNVSNIEHMEAMFLGAKAFNGDISSWQTGKVVDMNYMFNGAEAFNQNIKYNSGTGAWDVGKVTSMHAMFSGAKAFNGDISGWDVSKVTAMSWMFTGATVFNANISAWKTGAVTTMVGMFMSASAFNQNISYNSGTGAWDVSKVTDMSHMFSGANSFNGNISNWNTVAVTTMESMFSTANAFNQNLGSWNLKNVTNVSTMLDAGDGYGLDCKNFGLTLKGWAANVNTPSNLTLGANNRYLPNPVDKNYLISSKSWTFSGTDKGICDQTWLGTNSTNWSDGTNWNLGFVPGNGANIIISASALNNLTLTQDCIVKTLTFNGAGKNVVLSSYNLTITAFSGTNAGNRVITNGSGKLGTTIANNATFLFPIGNSTYNPVSITNKSGASDAFTVRVLDEAYEYGLTGSALIPPHVKRTWDINKSTPNGGSGVNFVFTWDVSQESASLTTPTLNHYNGSAWEIAAGSSSESGKVLTHTGYTGSFSPFSIGGSSIIPLPINLINFEATPNFANKTVDLTWTTTQEDNNDRFEILRSSDGQTWEQIGTVAGQGTTYDQSNYTFTDHTPVATSYYRLNQVDWDGTATLSDIRLVIFRIELNTPFSIYPNPSQGEFVLETEQGQSYSVTDLYGRIVAGGVLDSDKVSINLSTLNKGMYFVKVGNRIAKIVLE